MARIVVSGYMIRYPVAGMILSDFHYVLGLSRLGHKVFYIEESGWDQSCYDPIKRSYSNKPEKGVEMLRRLFERYRVSDVGFCYVDRDNMQTWGTDWAEAQRQVSNADFLLNVGGVCWLDEFERARKRVLIDKDPMFTQTKHLGLARPDQHDTLFSYGTNIGQTDCTVPTMGLDWHPLLPPVVPEIWQPTTHRSINSRDGQLRENYTTIANWSAYGSVRFEGETYGQKNTEFERFKSLPSMVKAFLTIAADNISDVERDRFIDAGWHLIEGESVSSALNDYIGFIQSSSGEFSVAKNAYVKTKSGWFSDRSVSYLASGLPVIVQETGISKYLHTGEGILTYSTLDDAQYCFDIVAIDREKHNKAALDSVSKYFDYRVVLHRLVEVSTG